MSKQPKLTFLLDENAPLELRQALLALGMNCARSRDEVGEMAPDHTIMSHARKHGMIVVTANKRDFQQARTKGPAYLFLYKVGKEPSVFLRRFHDVFLSACSQSPVFVELRQESFHVHRPTEPPALSEPIDPVPARKKRKRRGKPRADRKRPSTPPGSASPPAASGSS